MANWEKNKIVGAIAGIFVLVSLFLIGKAFLSLMPKKTTPVIEQLIEAGG
ncbi:MAG: hypothetical protein ABH858_05615 [Candidatus Omnitrophota bacterium]